MDGTLTRDPNTTDWVERRRRIYAARQQPNPDYLIGALRDPDHRALAAKFIGELQVREAADPLLILLRANDPHVRAQAVETLGMLGVASTRLAVRQVVETDPEAMVRAWAVDGLSRFRDPDDLNIIIQALRDPAARVRAAAALALGRVGDSQATQPLLAARRRLRRSPLEWYWYRRVYNDALRSLML